MKNKNMRELEKQWAEKAKKAAKPKQPKAKSREDRNQAASRTVREATKE